MNTNYEVWGEYPNPNATSILDCMLEGAQYLISVQTLEQAIREAKRHQKLGGSAWIVDENNVKVWPKGA